MYYEFYIDQFFVEHLLIGCLLMRLAVKLTRMDVPRMRILAAGLVNAAVMTLAVCAGSAWWYFAGLLLAGAVLFAGKTRSVRLQGFLALLFVTVGFGGALEGLLNLFGLPVLAGAVLALALIEAAGAYRERCRIELERSVEVELTFLERTLRICGIIDTGNQLQEPLTGRPVSIVEERAVRELLGDGWEARRGFYMIPYHSLGKDKGWMKGVSIDRMVVGTGERASVVAKPVLALYHGKISAGKAYRMILHPQHAAPGGRIT